MRQSSKNIFSESNNPSLRSLGEVETIQATYKTDEIFVGWKIADQSQYRDLVRYFVREYGDKPDEARRKANRKFPDLIGDTREPVYIDRSTADLIFIGGKPGSGKTALTRSITNRSARAGGNNFIVDPSHEYYTNNFYSGIQSHLEKLRDRESPQRIESKVVMPYYVKRRRKHNGLGSDGYQYTDFFQLRFSDLMPRDYAFLLKDKLTQGISADFDVFISELSSELEKDETSFSNWQDVINFAYRLNEEEKFNWQRRADVIKTYIESNYKGNGFFGNRNNLEWENIFDDQNTVVLSLQTGGDKYEHLGIFELYTAVCCRKIYNERLKGNIDTPLEFSGDEAHLLAPSDVKRSKHPSKRFFRKAAKQGRKRGVRLNLASQEPTDIQDKNFLSLGRHFFIPYNMSDTSQSKPRKHLLELAGVWRGGDSQSGKWDRIFQGMKKFSSRFPWLYCFNGSWMVIEPCSPLANHLEQE